MSHFLPPPPGAPGSDGEPPPPQQHQVPPPPPKPGARPLVHAQFAATPAGQRRVPVVNSYDHERATWGLGDYFVSVTVFIVGSIALALGVIAIAGEDSLTRGPWLVLVVAGPHALLLLHLVWVRSTKGTGFGRDFQFRFEWSDAALAVGLFMSGLIAGGIVAAGLVAITGETPTSAATDLALDSGAEGLTISLYAFAILGATFVPVVEELVYRGLFWSALEKRGMRPWTILFVTSAVFAIVHLEPVRTPVLFVVGMAIGAGRLLTGRIGASIATHMFINAIAMIVTLVELS